MSQRLIAAVVVLLAGSSLCARQSGIKGIDLPADPMLPIPYHDTRARRLADELAKLKPTAVRAAAPLGIGATGISLLIASDVLFPGEINGTLSRMVYYTGIVKGLVRFQLLHRGMTQQTVWQLLGDSEGGISMKWSDASSGFYSLGVSVLTSSDSYSAVPPTVSEVKWHFFPFQPRRITTKPNR